MSDIIPVVIALFVVVGMPVLYFGQKIVRRIMEARSARDEWEQRKERE